MTTKPTYEELERRVQELEKIESEYKSSKEALRNSEAQYRLLFEHANVGIFIAQDGYLKVANPCLSQILGYWRAELEEQPFSLFIHPEYQSLVATRHQERLSGKTGLPQTYDLRVISKNGKIIWVQLSTVVIQMKGRPATLNFLHDITEPKRVEEEWRESKFQKELILNATSELVAYFDTDLRINWVNTAAASSVGKRPEEMIGSHCYSFWNHINEPCSDCPVIKARDEKVPQEAEKRTPDGRHWNIRGFPIFEEDKVIGLAEFVHDITDRKRAEKELIELKRRNQALLDYSPVCHKIVDLDFNLQYMSASGFRMLKFEYNAQIYGKPYPFAFFPSTFRNEMIQNLKKVKKTGNSIIIEALAKDIEGNDIWLESTLIPVFDDDGNIEYLTVVSADTTWRKEDEKEKERLERQLQQTQKMESIGSLAGGIAHDFNNLLFPIVGLSEMMLNDFPTDSLEHKNIRAIYTAGTRGRELVQQILSFSRQSEYHLISVHIQKILKEVLKLCRATIPADITINRDIQTDCRPVMADPTQVHQIAMNLITNAYHAVESTGGTITVQLKETDFIYEDDPALQVISARYAVLSVSDTGTGIDPVVMNKIFDPYFTTKEKGKGTGLGLATVYGIVKAHGGDIKVHSDIGKGSTFHVYLPVLEKSAEVDPEKQQQPLPTGTEHILLVDDEPPIVHMEKQMLERLGYRITSFSSSVDALAAFRIDPSRFDLILTDMNMPNLNGMLLAEQLTAIRSDIPVIICTGFSERINKENAAAKGIRDLLMKPVVMKDLAQKVREVLDTMKK